MQTINQSRTLTPKQMEKVNTIWNRVYPVQVKDRLASFLNETDEQHHFYIENEKNELIAWSVFILSKDEWRFSLLVDTPYQGMGLGSILLTEMKKKKNNFFGWVVDHDNDVTVDGNKYRSPLLFYQKNGFNILTGRRLETPLFSGREVKWEGENLSY